MADDLQPFTIRQAHVGQAQVEVLLPEQLQGLGDIGGTAGLDVHPTQGQIQQFENVGLVVNDQGQRFVHRLLRAVMLLNMDHTSRLG